MTVSTRLDTLIREKGIMRYGVFFSTVEGGIFPDGSYDGSGYVIDQDGRIYSYWIGWDTNLGRAVFSEWREIDNARGFDRAVADDPEYMAAYEAAGLS